MRIKALLLAAGYGTRLRPITNVTPKCLVKINGKPLLSYWLKKLENLGCEEVIVNTHYLSHEVIRYLDKYKSNNLKVITSHEEEILGTAGTLMKHLDFFENSIGLLIHADNFTFNDLSEFVKHHYLRPKDCIITMLTFNTKDPSSCGIVKKDKEGKVIEFHEKSEKNMGNCANGALYAFDKEFIEFLKKLPYKVSDFSIDVIPLIMGKIFSWHTSDIYIDIGNLNSLKEANLIASSQTLNGTKKT